MAVGQVSFHNEKKVCRRPSDVMLTHLISVFHRSSEVRTCRRSKWNWPSESPGIVYVAKRENPIVNRLNKTKVVREVNHEAEQIERLKKESAIRRAAALEKVRQPSQSRPSLRR